MNVFKTSKNLDGNVLNIKFVQDDKLTGKQNKKKQLILQSCWKIETYITLTCISVL